MRHSFESLKTAKYVPFAVTLQILLDLPTYRYFVQSIGFCIRENINLGKNSIDVLTKLFGGGVLPDRHFGNPAATDVQIFRPPRFRQRVMESAKAFTYHHVHEITQE